MPHAHAARQGAPQHSDTVRAREAPRPARVSALAKLGTQQRRPADMRNVMHHTCCVLCTDVFSRAAYLPPASH